MAARVLFACAALLLVPAQASQLTALRVHQRLRGGSHAEDAHSLGEALDSFMETFRHLEAAAQTSCLPGPFGFRPSDGSIRKRPERVALHQALELVEAAHSALGQPSDSLDYALSSSALLKQLALLLGAEGAVDPTAEVAAEVIDLRAKLSRKSKGTVATAVEQLRTALQAPREAHAQLLRAIRATTPRGVEGVLSREEITQKLNAIPTFCILDAKERVVTMRDAAGGESCLWFTDPATANATMRATMDDNPSMAGLHLGVVPLGVAFETCNGWSDATVAAESTSGSYLGQLLLQGNPAELEGMGEHLRKQLRAEGMVEGGWQLPVFVCDEMQTEHLLPLFFSRTDLAETWVASGRSAESLPEAIAVMDLRLLVSKMATQPGVPWNTALFFCSSAAAELAEEARAHAQARKW